MSTMLSHKDIELRPAPRKFRENGHPARKASVTVPLALNKEARNIVSRTREPSPTMVDFARTSGDADAQAALLKLRELVVGPAQQLNEARLEELMKIFEEREAELRTVMRDIQKRNSELEVALKQSSLDQLNEFKAEFQALTDAMNSDSKKLVASIRDDVSAARKEALSLVQEAKLLADQKLDAQFVRTTNLVETEAGKLRVDLDSMAENLETSISTKQRETQANISRVLKDAAENLVRVSLAS